MKTKQKHYGLLAMLAVLFTMSFSAIAQVVGGDTPVIVPDANTNWVLFLIPVVVPVFIAILKLIIPKIPTAFLPIIAPLLGAVIQMIDAQAFGTNAILGAALGAAGVGLREVYDQTKKSMTANTVKLLLFLLLPAGFIGCASLETNAYKTLAVTAQTVSTAKAAYGDYLRTEIAALDLMTPMQRATRIVELREQRDKAAKAYGDYQKAAEIAEAAVKAAQSVPGGQGDWTAAMDAASQAALSFIAAVKPYIK